MSTTGDHCAVEAAAENNDAAATAADDKEAATVDQPTTIDDDELCTFRDKIKIFEQFSAPTIPQVSNRRDFLRFGLFRKRNQSRQSQRASETSRPPAVGDDGRVNKSTEFAVGNTKKHWHSTPTLGVMQNDDASQCGNTDSPIVEVSKKLHWTVRLSNRLHRIRQVFEQKRGGTTPPRPDQGLRNASSRLSLVSVFPDLDIEDVVNKDSVTVDNTVNQSVPENHSEGGELTTTTTPAVGKCKTPVSEKGNFIAELLLKFSQISGSRNGSETRHLASVDKCAKGDQLLAAKKHNKQSNMSGENAITYVEAERIDCEVVSGQDLMSCTEHIVDQQNPAAGHHHHQPQQQLLQPHNGHNPSLADNQ